MNRSDFHTSKQGVALIIVLWVIVILSLLIGGFAFTMQTETQIASFSRKELKADALARSGIEIARLKLLVHNKTPVEVGFEALSQKWANDDDAYVNQPLGEGTFTVIVADEESRLPINQLDETQLHRLLHLIDPEILDADTIADSILDWVSPGDTHRLNGAKSDFYMQQPIPYRAKNSPMDRIEELLLVQGVTPGLFYGLPATTRHEARPGLKELCTATSAGRINVNTASALVLQAALNIDEMRVAAILERRNGSDGKLGTTDDHPFRSFAEFLAEFGPRDSTEKELWEKRAGVSSQFFRVTSTGEVGGVKRTIVAVLCHVGNDYEILSWTPLHGGSR